MCHQTAEVLSLRIQRAVLHSFPDIFPHHEIRIEALCLQIRLQRHEAKQLLIISQHIHMKGLNGLLCIRAGCAQHGS